LPGGARGAVAELAAWLPLVLMLVAAGVGPLRVPILLVLLVGFLAYLWRGRADRISASSLAFAYGACLLIAMSVAWSGVMLPASARDGSTCASLGAPFALDRLVGAVLVLGAAALVVRLLHSTARDIGLQRGSRTRLGLALGALCSVGVVAVLVGPTMAQPFFGPLPVAVGNPLALVPALVFALANAGMEETVYRGVLLRWVLRSRGPMIALAVQAIAFGLAHGVSSDFSGSPLPVMAATAAAGLVLGAISLRTGSLLLPIALHAALDLPIYFANACLQR